MNFDLPTQNLVAYIPIIEKFLLAENKQAFIASLPKEGTDFVFLQLCTQKLNWESHQKLIDKLGLSHYDKTSLQKLQTLSILLDQKSSNDDRDKAIELVKRELHLSFDHPKPSTATSYTTQGINQQQLPSELKSEDYSFNKFLQTNNYEGFYANLTQYGFSKLNKDQILNLRQNDFDAVIQSYNFSASGNDGLEIIRKYIEVKRKINNNFVLPVDIYKRLTSQQLSDLPNYVNEVRNSKQYILWRYKKTFGNQINSQFKLNDNKLYTSDQLNQKRELLSQSINWLKDLKQQFLSSFIDQLIIEILTIDIITNRPNVDLFRQYLKRPRQITSQFSDTYRNDINTKRSGNYVFDNYWFSAHQLSFGLWPNDTNLIENYLRLIFRHDSHLDKIKEFSVYFKRDFVSKLLYKVRLQKGEDTPNIHTIFSKDEQNQLKNRKQLTISDKNKKKFKIAEQISLQLLVKNVQEITAEIYEISTEKHFLSSDSQIDNSISLEFLEPLKKVIKKVNNDNPFRVNEVDFSLTEHLEAKNSIYIIDFQGQGILSRAVIRRGSIAAITRPTLAGIEIGFFQQDGNSINELDIWLRGRKVHVNGKYTIPYGQSTQNLNIVAVKNNYAELIKVTVSQESYSWKISYTYHEQNFLVGSKAKVLLNAQLSSNSGVISTQALKETTIIVNTLNHLNIPSTLSFKNINWDHKNQYELQIPIQSYLQKIDISVSAQVDKYVGKPQQLSSTKTIIFRTGYNPLLFIEFFLSFTNQGFILKLLGKNGQPKPLNAVSLNIQSKLVNSNIVVNLITDKNGEIKLGKLEDVSQIIATSHGTADIQPTECSWNFNFALHQVSYNDELALNEGQEFFLPVYKGFSIQNQVVLTRISEQAGELSDETHRLRFDNNQLHAQLSKGTYVLKFLQLSKIITIEVAKLTQWGNSQQLIDQQTRTVYALSTQTKDPVSLSNDYSKSEQGDSYKISLKLQVKDKASLENVRVHILASSFIYRNDYSKDISQTIPQGSGVVSLKLNSNICSYLNDKELSDQHCYILNRQKEDKFIGNNLERPRVLLKRTFNRDTTVKKEQLDGAKDFRSRDEAISMSKKCKKMAGGYGATYRAGYGGDPRRQGITLFNNFLKHPSAIVANIHGESIEFVLPKVYQSFVVIVASPSFVFERLFSLDNVPLQTNNLVSTGLKQSNEAQAFTISRQCYKLQKGQVLKVKRSSLWAAVSASNLSILSEINGNKLYDWVNNWPTYSQEKKIEVYDQYVCHELNTYIKYKDTDFFQKVVKPFISNKLQKGIVDFCLLNDQGAEKYVGLEYYNKLNAFEKCLLVEFLVKNKKEDKAKPIVEALNLEYKSQKIPYSEFEKKFDIVMTSKQIAQSNTAGLTTRNAFGGGAFGASIQYCSAQMMQCQMLNQVDYFASPPPGMAMNKMARAMPMMAMAPTSRTTMLLDADLNDGLQQLEQRKKFKPGFQQVQKTKQYVETTYYEMKNPLDSSFHIPLSKFWVQLAQFFLNPQNQFLSENFIYLNSKQQLSLAVSFLPLPLVANYNIKAQNEFVIITAESSFMVFVKEIKSMQFQSKYGILISQRISDPTDQYIYEDDGTTLEKPVEQFIKDKPYYLNTVVTNTSTANLELQVLIDVPEGSIPLNSNQNTKVESQTIGSYQTISLQRIFYFPQSGTFNLYPANASKNRQVISKANALEKIVVKDQRTNKKLETLNDVLSSGSKSDILNFLETKNIFDGTFFSPYSILWLLKDKDMFNEVAKILKNRSYFSHEIHQFGFLHKDPQIIRQFILNSLSQTPLNQKVLEYYPLTSQRAHKFMKSEKSTILNQTFKQTYQKFLIDSLLSRNADTPLFLTVFTYYLILQDRVKDANEVFKTLSKQKDQVNFPRIQYDYLACFIDMYTGYPNFAVARQISAKYVNYPVLTWQKLFKQVDSLLNTHDTTVFEEDSKQEHDIRITIKGNKLSLLLPQKTTVELNFHAVNIELLFSNSPFDDVKLFSTIRPFKTVVVTSEKGGQQFVDRPEGYSDVYVNPVELSATKQGQVISSFLWSNDSVKVKVLEDEGVAVVFVDGKPKPGAYCKVYAKGKQTRFYKDGYTDIQGRFKYISQLDDVEKFSILFITEKGGITKFARTPSKNGFLG